MGDGVHAESWVLHHGPRIGDARIDVLREGRPAAVRAEDSMYEAAVDEHAVKAHLHVVGCRLPAPQESRDRLREACTTLSP